MIKEKITIYYDKECPFCNSYVGYLKLKDSYELILKNVREIKDKYSDSLEIVSVLFQDEKTVEQMKEFIKEYQINYPITMAVS